MLRAIPMSLTRASIKALEIQIRQMSKVVQERGSGSLPSSTKMNLRDHVNSISTAEDTNTPLIHRIGSTRYAVSDQLNSTDISEIARKPSKTSKHGHENGRVNKSQK
ncbi:hypothetical protein Tco_0923041 [Tanacetum coccineum]|uniref:Uncharacterized protein n=1 Tax=Tanacetum coccineum TaxID=301880 RepID=A0ABQ5D172_9ASTR